MNSHLRNNRIRIIPLGNISLELLHYLQQNLESRHAFTTFIAPQQDIPQGTFDKHREQFLGDGILAFLRSLRKYSGDTLLGITNQDCYTDSLNYIFGQASLKGFEAFISLFRLQTPDCPSDSLLFKERTITEAVHELGHTRGLAHCENPHCVMHFSKSITDTDKKGSQYCEKCEKMLV